MAPVAVAGIWETILIFVLGGGLLPVPVGVPPLPEDPALLRVAPEGTLFFAQWFGVGKPDPASSNRSERIAAHPEVRHLFRSIESAVRRAIRENTRGREGRLAEEAVDLLSAVLSNPGVLFVSKVDPRARAFPVEGGVVVRAGDAAPQIRRSLSTIEDFLLSEMRRGRDGLEVATIDVAGESFRVLPLPPQVPPVAWGVAGDYAIVSVGEGLPGMIVKALESGETDATAKGSVASRLKAVRVERPMSRVYVDLASMFETVRGMGGPDVTEKLGVLGLTGATALISEAGLEGEDFVSRALLATTGEPTGLLKLASGPPLTDDDLSIIPGDATLAGAARLDLVGAYKEFLSVLERVEPNARRRFEGRFAEEFEEEIGLRLVEDILEPLGDVWTVWNAPSEGGLVVTGLTAAVRIKDRQRAERALDRVVDAARREMRGPERSGRRPSRGVYIESFTFEGTEIYYLNAIGEEMPVAPSWCLTDSHLMFSLYPQMLKANLARKNRVETSIAKHPALAERGSACALTCVDTAEIFRLAYPLLHPLAQVGLAEIQREGFDLTIAALPSASAILPHLGPGVSTLEKTPDGIRFVSRGPLPAVGPMGAGLIVPLFAPFAVYRSAGAVHPARVEAWPEHTAPAEQPAGPAEKEAEPTPVPRR